MEYRTAPEVEWIAEELIEEHHELLESRGPRIEYVLAKAPAASASRGRLFRIRKITGIHAFLASRPLPDRFGEIHQAEPFFVIEISNFWWHAMKPEQQKGMVDHILAHLVFDDGWKIEPPEFGEFPEVFERHGFWRPGKSFRRFAKRVSEQLSLLPDELEESENDEFAGVVEEVVSEGAQLFDGEQADKNEGEDLDVSITFGDRTVETNTRRMQEVSNRLSGGKADTVIVNGQVVDKETGEVLEGSRA